MVFRCADAGVSPEMVFGQKAGSLIDVSTWGHTVDSGVMGGIELAVDELDVPLIVVLGHHGCGAMREAMRAWNDVDLPKGDSRIMVEQTIGSIVRRERWRIPRSRWVRPILSRPAWGCWNARR